MDLYAENVLDHYRHPRNKKSLPAPTIRHEEKNLSCGDALTLDVMIENDKIIRVGWSGDGCAISQAAISLLSEELIDMDLLQASNITPKFIHDLLGVPVGPRRTKCALLCLHTLKNAINVHRGDKPQGWVKTVATEGGGS